jgi:hypothetical protein
MKAGFLNVEGLKMLPDGQLTAETGHFQMFDGHLDSTFF